MYDYSEVIIVNCIDDYYNGTSCGKCDCLHCMYKSASSVSEGDVDFKSYFKDDNMHSARKLFIHYKV